MTLENEVEILRKKTAEQALFIAQLEGQILNDQVRIQHAEDKAKMFSDEYDRLTQQYLQAQRNRFGKKSERFVDCNFEPLHLFPDEAPNSDATGPDTSASAETEQNPDDLEPVAFLRKKKGSSKPDYSQLPTREVIIPVSEADRICACCGNQKEVIRHESSSRLSHQPAVFEMIVEKREVCACRKGCDGSVATAPKPLRILPKCKATESLLAYIAVSKVLDRQPLYHLETSIAQRYGWRIPRQTMARWMIMMADPLQPLINLMKDELIGYDIAAIDATSLQVLAEPGRSPETKSDAYCVRGGPPGKEVIIYEYNAYSQKEYVKETMADFKGIISCDADPVFNGIGDQAGVTLSYCHAHARRKFEEIVKMNQSGPLAKEAMRIYRDLYAIERQMNLDKLSVEARLNVRQEKSKPILGSFHQWLVTHSGKTLPKSPIGKAIAYALKHWDGLQVYLNDGRVPIDNNATERDIKPFVMARKNFLFAATPGGADALGVHFSLILTARQHGLNPLVYYQTILEKIPYCQSFQEYKALLPWNFEKTP